jgi:hypothetical protein
VAIDLSLYYDGCECSTTIQIWLLCWPAVGIVSEKGDGLSHSALHYYSDAALSTKTTWEKSKSGTGESEVLEAEMSNH